MSKYSDKKRAKPPCTWPQCENDGTVILVFDGHAGWFCEAHKSRVRSEG